MDKLLRESGIAYEKVNYYTQPLSKKKLTELLRKMKMKPRELLRKSEAVYKELGLAEDKFSDSELIALMIEHPDFKMKFVAVLLVTFSVIFPTLKLGASLIYFFNERWRQSRVLQFFAFKIGKWSMADVMVIAILMSYIGFNGIVDTQFNKMKAIVPKDVSFFTTNGTTMQMGYFIFITYVLLALVLSTYVHKVPGKKSPESVSN